MSKNDYPRTSEKFKKQYYRQLIQNQQQDEEIRRVREEEPTRYNPRIMSQQRRPEGIWRPQRRSVHRGGPQRRTAHRGGPQRRTVQLPPLSEYLVPFCDSTYSIDHSIAIENRNIEQVQMNKGLFPERIEIRSFENFIFNLSHIS